MWWARSSWFVVGCWLSLGCGGESLGEQAFDADAGPDATPVALLARVQKEAPGHADKLAFRWYSHDGETPIDGNLPHASHLKYMSVDGQLAIVGSTNMDTIAWNHSRETNLAVDSAAVVDAWDAQVFVPSWARGIW